MDKKKTCYTIPHPSLFIDNYLSAEEKDSAFILRYAYIKNDVPYKTGLRFDDCRAYRFRSFDYCTGWHIDGVYLTLAQVEGSSWLKELKTDAYKEWKEYNSMNHYMIFMENTGCYEMIAGSWELLPIEEGHLEEP